MDDPENNAYSYADALELVIQNQALPIQDVKCLRLTCKRTKALADDQITKMDINFAVDPDRLKASGLLPRLKEITVDLEVVFMDIMEASFHFEVPWINDNLIQRCAQIIADECSQTLHRLNVGGSFSRWSSEQQFDFCTTLGEADFLKLEVLDLKRSELFLNVLLLAGGSNDKKLPSLKALKCCDSLRSDDMSALMDSPPILRNLEEIYVVEEIATTRVQSQSQSLEALAEAVNLKKLRWLYQNKLLTDIPFQSLEYLHLDYIENEGGTLTALLSRPWPQLQHLVLDQGHVRPEDVLALGDAVESFPVLQTLEFMNITCDWAAFQNTKLPIIKLVLYNSVPSHVGGQADALSESLSSLPALRHFDFNAEKYKCLISFKTIEPLVSGPHMSKLESLAVRDLRPQHAVKFVEALAANFVLPNMKSLELFFGLPSGVAMKSLLGYGALGGLPNLEQITFKYREYGDNKEMGIVMTEEEATQAFHRIWPNIVVKFVLLKE